MPQYEVQKGGKQVARVTVEPDGDTLGGSVVRDLFVDPEHRRQGLARRLLRQVKAQHAEPLRIRPRPFDDMGVDSSSLKGFYASEGFKDLGDKRDNMVLDKLAFGSFVDLLEKLAALDDNEKKLFQQVLANQQKFDGMASGKMTEAQQEAHRVNTERMQHFLNKRSGKTSKIPSWAMNPEGPKPGGSAGRAPGGTPAGSGGRYYGRRPAGPVMSFIARHPYAAAAGAGAAYGGLIGGLNQGLRSKKEEKRQIQEAKKSGPISEFAAKNPTLAGAAYGGMSLPAVVYGARKAGMFGALAGSYAPGLALAGVNKGLKMRQDSQDKEEKKRKRREEYARKAKSPVGVPKPVAGPAVIHPA